MPMIVFTRKPRNLDEVIVNTRYAGGNVHLTEIVETVSLSRVLRLTLLAPEIIEMILAGRQPAELTMAKLMKPFPVEWRRQAEIFLPPAVTR